MHKLKYILPFVFTCLLLSCEKDDSPSIADCNVNGVWIGEWESNLQITGTFCANVKQNTIDFSGDIGIRIEEPSAENYNRDFDGTVKSKKAKTVMTIGGVEIAAEGDVLNDTMISGNFQVPDLNMSGTFTGNKIPTTEASLTKIYGSLLNSEEHISDFIYIDNSLWIFIYPEIWYDEGPKTKVLKYSTEGNLIETIYYTPVMYYDIASDGQYIWNLYNGVHLFKYDTSGNKIDSLDIPASMHSHKIACSSSNLFLFNEGIIYKTSHSLNNTETINPRFNFPGAYAIYNDKQLYSSGNILYKMNSGGEIVHAYVLPEGYNISDIETNGKKVWCFVNWFDENSGSNMYPFHYEIYEIDIN